MAKRLSIGDFLEDVTLPVLCKDIPSNITKNGLKSLKMPSVEELRVSGFQTKTSGMVDGNCTINIKKLRKDHFKDKNKKEIDRLIREKQKEFRKMMISKISRKE
eukprot:TRINITY_DN3963_c0_g2_i1.p1 TRINITY_DN3963_c0_g2~~TRINITY_DN3963_c0_g2_i1.p1  ORF type:complete len:104 (+),score=11.28 TRINITY_DN3963_c0_g2_i1:80-391(+)